MASRENLVKLHTLLIDAQNGYEEAAKDAGEPRVASYFREMAAFHRRNADEIRDLARTFHVEMEDSGSLLSVVHRTVVKIRSSIVRLDATELKPFISGEEQIVSQYDQALDEGAGGEKVITLLNRQKREALKKIGEMKAMKDVAENR